MAAPPGIPADSAGSRLGTGQDSNPRPSGHEPDEAAEAREGARAHDESLLCLGLLAERYVPDDPDTPLPERRQAWLLDGPIDEVARSHDRDPFALTREPVSRSGSATRNRARNPLVSRILESMAIRTTCVGSWPIPFGKRPELKRYYAGDLSDA